MALSTDPNADRARQVRPLSRQVRARRFLATARMVVHIYTGYKLLQIRGAITGKSSQPGYYDEQHRRSASIIRNTAVKLEGLLIKACQFAGSRADILPPAFIEVLSELHDRVPPHPFAEIGQWVADQLGRPLDECFSSIEETPIASASLAQVHRARLLDGTVVAVKVQYPNIDRVIASDLATFAFFVRLLARLERRFDLRILLREIGDLIPLELDFVNEAKNARRFADNFKDNHAVEFPSPIDQLTCTTVLTMSYIEGIKISDVDAMAAAGIDKHQVADLLARTYMTQIMAHGFFHGDPHPGNLLIKPGPTLVILDLGLAKEFTEQLRRGVVKLAAAIIARNPKMTGEAFRDLGFETKSGSDDTFLTIAELFLGQALDAGRAYADIGMVERIRAELLHALRENPLVRASSDLLLLLRVMGLISGVGKQLDSRVDPVEMMKQFLLTVAASPKQPRSSSATDSH